MLSSLEDQGFCAVFPSHLTEPELQSVGLSRQPLLSRTTLGAKRDKYSDRGATGGTMYKRLWQVLVVGGGILLGSMFDVGSVSVTAGRPPC